MPDEDEQRDDEIEENDDEDQENEEADQSSSGRSGMVDTLMTQIGDHKEVLAPVATSAAAAVATYAAKKLPDLIDRLEQGGGDAVRSKLEDASDAGGVKGFVSGTASRVLSGSGGSLIGRLKEGGKEEGESEARESGGLAGAAAKAKEKLSGGEGEGGSGWGKGRRLPLMRSIDVAAPIGTVYDQWTQFEEFGSFMHRVEGIEQQEPESVVWHENVWGRKRDWDIEIIEQVPRERIEWKITGGGQGLGVITFHELAPRLTRLEIVFDWQPTGLVEKIASGLRFHKRAARSDLSRFKAFVETRGEATGGWRGRIEDGHAKAQTRNKRNREADPIPTEARQHESDEENQQSSSRSKTQGGHAKKREVARTERARHRAERAGARKSGRS